MFAFLIGRASAVYKYTIIQIKSILVMQTLTDAIRESLEGKLADQIRASLKDQEIEPEENTEEDKPE